MDQDSKAEKTNKILFREESYAIQGAIFEVYRVMGNGFLEAVYQECLAMEFRNRQIPFAAQVEVPLVYRTSHWFRFIVPTSFVLIRSSSN